MTCIYIRISIGISTTLLRVHQYSAHHYFYKEDIEPLITKDMKGKHCSCLSAHPWVSWWLPLECKKIYTIQLYDDFFPGYNKASFRRFENPKVCSYYFTTDLLTIYIIGM